MFIRDLRAGCARHAFNWCLHRRVDRVECVEKEEAVERRLGSVALDHLLYALLPHSRGVRLAIQVPLIPVWLSVLANVVDALEDIVRRDFRLLGEVVQARSIEAVEVVEATVRRRRCPRAAAEVPLRAPADRAVSYLMGAGSATGARTLPTSAVVP